eukprot:1153800-Pelagomonas_calceolata.AAC.1
MEDLSNGLQNPKLVHLQAQQEDYSYGAGAHKYVRETSCWACKPSFRPICRLGDSGQEDLPDPPNL